MRQLIYQWLAISNSRSHTFLSFLHYWRIRHSNFLIVYLILLGKILFIQWIKSVNSPHTQYISSKCTIKENSRVKYKGVALTCPTCLVLIVGENDCGNHAVAVKADQTHHDKFWASSLKTDRLSIFKKVVDDGAEHQSEQNNHKNVHGVGFWVNKGTILSHCFHDQLTLTR